jgi:hypothetical protein
MCEAGVRFGERWYRRRAVPQGLASRCAGRGHLRGTSQCAEPALQARRTTKFVITTPRSRGLLLGHNSERMRLEERIRGPAGLRAELRCAELRAAVLTARSFSAVVGPCRPDDGSRKRKSTPSALADVDQPDEPFVGFRDLPPRGPAQLSPAVRIDVIARPGGRPPLGRVLGCGRLADREHRDVERPGSDRSTCTHAEWRPQACGGRSGGPPPPCISVDRVLRLQPSIPARASAVVDLVRRRSLGLRACFGLVDRSRRPIRVGNPVRASGSTRVLPRCRRPCAASRQWLRLVGRSDLPRRICSDV